VYALVLLPRSRSAQMSLQSTSIAQETAVAEIVDATATSAMMTDIVAAYTATPTNTPIPPTETPTLPPTPVVAVADTQSPVQTEAAGGIPPEAATATARFVTLEAILTQNAGTPTLRATSTGIPNTGFADDIGLPMMVGMALLLVLVIFFARRLRSAA
jgi:LPXTG-motif cell wall-anchored protein